YRDIRFLLAGETVTVRPDAAPRFNRYWHLAMAPEIRLRSAREYAEALREKLEAAVRQGLRSRHPVGSMLSGGLDSTGVAALAARELAGNGGRLATFSNVLGDDERAPAKDDPERAYIDAALEQYPNMNPRWAFGRRFPVVAFDDAALARNDE